MGPYKADAAAERKLFVDEAGDPTLFARGGRVIVGLPGCSRYFIVGVLQVDNPGALNVELEALRLELLADPYFSGVPSMDPRNRKTAVLFHAKDDVPEVRREVFRLLTHHKLRFLACVKDKLPVVKYVRQRNEADREYRYRDNDLYDLMVRRLFRDLLHRGDAYEIYFATRGSSSRTDALRGALWAARQRAQRVLGVASQAPVNVITLPSAQHPCLQAADYFLWALQRLYVRREDRYVQLLWPAFRLVVDMDDTREKKYGAYYTQDRPLTAKGLPDVPGI